MAKRRRQPAEQPAFPKHSQKRIPRAKAEPTVNARGYSLAEWKAADYDPEQFDTAQPTGKSEPASAIVGDLIEQLRGPELVVIAARIIEHPLAPKTKRRPASHDLAHALSYGKESLWYPAAEAVARKLAIDAADEATEGGDANGARAAEADTVTEGGAFETTPTETPIEHLARCGTCGFSVRFLPTASAAGFVLDAGDLNLDIGENGRPICREDAHGEMGLADEQLVPASEAIGQVAERVNGDRPTQAQLFELAKPFNFEGAWLEIEAKQAEIDVLAREHEDAASEAKSAKKALDDARETLGRMIHTWQSRRLQKTRDQAEQADRIAEAASASESDEVGEAEESPEAVEIVGEAGSDAGSEAVL